MVRSRMTLGLTLAACGTMVLCAIAAEPARKPGKPGDKPVVGAPEQPVTNRAEESEPAIAEVADEDLGPWEVTEQVELVFREPLAISGDQTLAAKILLKNKSDQPLPGKLVVVIDGTSVSAGEIADPSGRFTEETSYIQLLPAKRELGPGDETAVRNLLIKTQTPTNEMNLEGAELRWRAFTTTKPAGLEDEVASDEKQVPGKQYTWGDMRQVMTAQSAATMDLVKKHDGGVVGTATGEDENGKLVVRVFTSRGGMARKLPGQIGGVPVEVSVVGSFRAGPAYSSVTYENGVPRAAEPLVPMPDAEAGAATGGRVVAQAQAAQTGLPTSRFARPVPIGVSVANQTDSCSAGTLGCRVMGRDGKVYALSNNHVFAGLNSLALLTPIAQPGLVDNNCRVVSADQIGTLYKFEPMQFFARAADADTAPVNIIDAAIAEVTTANVDVCTPTAGYGTPARNPLENLPLGLQVQKYGRTTGLTRGRVAAVNVESVITLGNPNGYARFKYSISVQGMTRGMVFSRAGDSGSLVVTVADRRPVGLLYAGSSAETLICPISVVFNRLGIGVDNGTGGKPITGSGRMGVAVGPTQRRAGTLQGVSE